MAAEGADGRKTNQEETDILVRKVKAHNRQIYGTMCTLHGLMKSNWFGERELILQIALLLLLLEPPPSTPLPDSHPIK